LDRGRPRGVPCLFKEQDGFSSQIWDLKFSLLLHIAYQESVLAAKYGI